MIAKGRGMRWLAPNMVAAAVLVLAGCGTASKPSSAISPSPTPVMIAASASQSTVPTPTVTPTAAPTPPPPTLSELGAAYLAAATKHNKSIDATWKAFSKTSKGLTATRKLASGYATATLTFIREVQAIAWWGDPKSIARRLLTCDNEAYVWYATAAKEKRLSPMVSDLNKGDAKSVKCAAAANELRISLDLAPIPIT